MALEYPSVVAAAGSVNANGTEVWSDGAAAANTGTGTYTLTMDGGGLAAAECVVDITIRGTTAGFKTVAQTSNTVKTVNVFDTSGNAANLSFDYVILAARNA